MARLELTDSLLTLQLSLLEKLLALRRDLVVPLSHVRDVSVRPPEARTRFPGVLLIGTRLPGVITAGTFRTRGGWAFFLVRDPRRTIRIDLEGEFYRTLIVQLDNLAPEEAAARIRAAIRPESLGDF